MKAVEIKHYVKTSFEGKPSFVILMSDGKEYISNGCVFVENIQENIDDLVESYDYQDFIDELLQAPAIKDDELVNGSFMYAGCTSLTQAGYYPSLKDGYYMYHGCTNLQQAGDYPKLEDGYCMYRGCTSLQQAGDYPKLEDGSYMYHGCTSLQQAGDYPKLEAGSFMYEGCLNIQK